MKVESGLRNVRAHWVEEATEGETPADPSWQRFSDVIGREAVSAQPDRNIEGQRGVGSPDPQEFFGGSEDHGLTVPYDLQRWLVSGGTPQDPIAYAMMRDVDNYFHATHSVLIRHTQETGGEEGNGLRVYTYARGCFPGTGTLAGNPGSSLPVLATVEYTPKMVESHQIDQPPSGGDTITVESTSANDTSQTLTLEDDAGVSEDVALNGTTAVATTKTDWSSLDAAFLDAYTEGDVIIKAQTSGNTLMTIRGQNSLDSEQGELGVPDVGAGSFEGALGTDFERIHDDTLQIGGSDLADVLSSFQIQVSNNLETDPQVGLREKAITVGNREIQVTADVFGVAQSHADWIRHLQATQADIVWTLSGGTITVQNAALTSVGNRDYQEGQTKIQLGNTFTGRGLAVA